MKKTALIYGSKTENTIAIVKRIQEIVGENEIELISVETAWVDDFRLFKNIIIGTSTWFDGELPDVWDEMIPALEDLNMKGKKVAIFGLGDQIKYPDNFADGVGILATLFESIGAKLYGFTSTEGYTFTQSKALKNDLFMGLVIDAENQSTITDIRISNWIKDLKRDSFL